MGIFSAVPILEPHHKRRNGAEVRVRGKVPRVRRDGLVPLERDADTLRALRPVIEPRARGEAGIHTTEAEWTFCRTALALSIEGHGRSMTR